MCTSPLCAAVLVCSAMDLINKIKKKLRAYIIGGVIDPCHGLQPWVAGKSILEVYEGGKTSWIVMTICVCLFFVVSEVYTKF